MKRLIVSGLSFMLLLAATAPAFAASQVRTASTVNRASLLIQSNPPAEVPSPTLQYLDHSSAVQAVAPRGAAPAIPAEVPSPGLQNLDHSSAAQAVTPKSRLTSLNPPAELSSPALQVFTVRI